MSESITEPAAPPRRRGDRKSQIARIAADLFCERGYYTVGLGEIATEAGITGPAIYRHFRNKQAILAYATADLSAALERLTSPAARTGRSPGERLENIISEVVGLVVERRRSVQLYQWERRYLGSEDHDRFTAAIAALVDVVAELLGEVRPRLPAADHRTLASAALSAVASLSTHRTPLTARAATEGLRAVGLGVLATGLPPRLAGEPAQPAPEPAVGEFGSRRERLLAAALRPFRERGFHGVTMEDIGVAAGISGSSVYRHFPSKADLLAAVYYRAADRLTATTNAAIENAGEPGAVLRELVRAYVGFAFEHSDLAAVYLSEYENLPDDDRHTLRKVQREHVEQWVRLLTAVRENTRGAHARLVVHAALNIVHDLSMSRRRITDSAQVEYLVFAALAS
ncbi:transcriptional regulator, TetR family [Amycolatopsis marina]|uniref:Transcriptional regulator, TetR family n=1 Tax=Amycolatopsis marina TaxID=490629 RepID=A0A1I0ZTL6_9PSEU|nr:TetR/AcrR family transcriptional regulator [Amycolatopsis marina]SFB28847.1 transcriptional regulator, TetR family [Amycolatopsis marina]